MSCTDDFRQPHRGCFIRIGGRNDELADRLIAGQSCRDGECAAHSGEGAVERQLADKHPSPHIVIMEKFDPETCLAVVEKYAINSSQLVPTMFVRMLKLPEDVRAKVGSGDQDDETA